MEHSAPGDLLGLLVETESRAMAERWYSVKLQNEQEPETLLAASADIVDDYLILLKLNLKLLGGSSTDLSSASDNQILPSRRQ